MEPNIATASKPITIPGPNHPITIERNPARIVVSVGGRIVADTRAALTLREAAYPVVQYIPRKDVDMGRITPPTARTRGTPVTSASRSAATVRPTPCGATRR